MATHSSILAWRNPQTEETGGATVHGVTKESDMAEHAHTGLVRFGEQKPSPKEIYPKQELDLLPHEGRALSFAYL